MNAIKNHTRLGSPLKGTKRSLVAPAKSLRPVRSLNKLKSLRPLESIIRPESNSDKLQTVKENC